MTTATDEYYGDQDKPPPTVSRIVLYIDDLDRCREEKVVEVLRIVHLLLASPLFVCAVAVDPRWVTTCLWKAPGLIDHALTERSPSVDAPSNDNDEPCQAKQPDETIGESATPSDYLEKIFQIPLWLRPLPRAQRPAVVRALLDPGNTRSAGTSETALRAPIVPAAGQQSKVSPMERQVANSVNIDPIELNYLGHLRDLLNGNPRTLKRFVNTYRLVKSALTEVELLVFVNSLDAATGKLLKGESKERNSPSYRPYRLCMTQLAVLCTQRSRALTLVRHADATKPDQPLKEWLVGFHCPPSGDARPGAGCGVWLPPARARCPVQRQVLGSIASVDAWSQQVPERYREAPCPWVCQRACTAPRAHDGASPAETAMTRCADCPAPQVRRGGPRPPLRVAFVGRTHAALDGYL